MLNLFYMEPEEDRWLRFDRYPRRVVRRVLRGRPRSGGQKKGFLNLCAGLKRIGVPFRLNDFGFARKNPDSLACIVGKPFVLDIIKWRNPILFGGACYSHPVDDLELLGRLPVRMVLVPGPWVKKMCEPYWSRVESWPVGIDTAFWQPTPDRKKRVDVLLYDKVRWDHDRYESELVQPIRSCLRNAGRSYVEMRYGQYREEDFRLALANCRAMVFLCEHETQGLAYQQALSCSVPILAWDRGGPWQDPSYYPHKVVFSPVTSVPYWDGRCGRTFSDAGAFCEVWDEFWQEVQEDRFSPREYILANLTLERCAEEYCTFARSVSA